MGTESGIRNMTVGNPFHHILMFTLPLLAGNFLQQFYNMVDSWVVGNYVSDGALAAVGVGFPVIFLFTSLFSGIATGGTVVIAQSFGGRETDRVRSAIDSLYTAFIRSILPITAARAAAGESPDDCFTGGPRRLGRDPDLSAGGLCGACRQHRL